MLQPIFALSWNVDFLVLVCLVCCSYDITYFDVITIIAASILYVYRFCFCQSATWFQEGKRNVVSSCFYEFLEVTHQYNHFLLEKETLCKPANDGHLMSHRLASTWV